jgi:hypothetical protein
MTDVVVSKGKAFRDSLMGAKVKIVGGVAATGTVLVGYASAAINFTPITELITAVTGLIPSLMDLVIALAPLIVTMAIVSFLVVFFRKNILEMLNI